MAYIEYGQGTVGGTQITEVLANLRNTADQLRDLLGWIGQIGPMGLESHADFMVKEGQGQAFFDTLSQINGDMVGYMATNREKIERLARGD